MNGVLVVRFPVWTLRAISKISSPAVASLTALAAGQFVQRPKRLLFINRVEKEIKDKNRLA
jgi:hypothetical protein